MNFYRVSPSIWTCARTSDRADSLCCNRPRLDTDCIAAASEALACNANTYTDANHRTFQSVQREKKKRSIRRAYNSAGQHEDKYQAKLNSQNDHGIINHHMNADTHIQSNTHTIPSPPLSASSSSRSFLVNAPLRCFRMPLCGISTGALSVNENKNKTKQHSAQLIRTIFMARKKILCGKKKKKHNKKNQ